MPTLTIRNIPEDLLEALRQRAVAKQSNVNSEAIALLSHVRDAHSMEESTYEPQNDQLLSEPTLQENLRREGNATLNEHEERIAQTPTGQIHSDILRDKRRSFIEAHRARVDQLPRLDLTVEEMERAINEGRP